MGWANAIRKKLTLGCGRSIAERAPERLAAARAAAESGGYGRALDVCVPPADAGFARAQHHLAACPGEGLDAARALGRAPAAPFFVPVRAVLTAEQAAEGERRAASPSREPAS
jgi:hypothetical protein